MGNRPGGGGESRRGEGQRAEAGGVEGKENPARLV